PSLQVVRRILLPWFLLLIRWLISSMFRAPIPGHTLSQSVPSKSTAYTIKRLFILTHLYISLETSHLLPNQVQESAPSHGICALKHCCIWFLRLHHAYFPYNLV